MIEYMQIEDRENQGVDVLNQVQDSLQNTLNLRVNRPSNDNVNVWSNIRPLDKVKHWEWLSI